MGRAAKVNAALFSIPILEALKLRVQSFWNSQGGHRAGHRSLLLHSALRCRPSCEKKKRVFVGLFKTKTIKKKTKGRNSGI